MDFGGGRREHQEGAKVSKQGMNGPEEEEMPGTSEGMRGTTGQVPG